jgi:sugar phosphate isomerase/epimerase
VRAGLCTFVLDRVFAGQRDFADLAGVASAAGFTGIEGVVRTERMAVPFLPRSGHLTALRSLATVDLYRFPLTAGRPERRQRGLAALEAMVDAASAWAVPSISFSPGPLPPGVDPRFTFDALARDLEPVIHRAAAAGVRIAVENVPGECAGTRGLMSGLLARLNAPIGVCLDLANALLDPPVTGWIERFAPDLSKIHLSDATVDGVRVRPTLPGMGSIQWRDTYAALAASGFRGDVFVEAPRASGWGEREYLTRLRAAVDALPVPWR